MCLSANRKSTGVKTWVMLGIDKLGQEVLRVLTSNNIHMSSKGKDPLSAVVPLCPSDFLLCHLISLQIHPSKQSIIS